jgi:hypothetical protein
MTQEDEMAKANGRVPVLVCTDKRGVFMGWAAASALRGDGWRKKLTLKDARMCVYWSTDVRGVLGLAAKGPTHNCKVTPAVPEQIVVGVHGITRCTGEAVAAWEKEPWNS